MLLKWVFPLKMEQEKTKRFKTFFKFLCILLVNSLLLSLIIFRCQNSLVQNIARGAAGVLFLTFSIDYTVTNQVFRYLYKKNRTVTAPLYDKNRILLFYTGRKYFLEFQQRLRKHSIGKRLGMGPKNPRFLFLWHSTMF